MKLKYSNPKKDIKKKRITFSAILNSEQFFHRSGIIQMALKNERVLAKDFHVKRARSKIDIGKKIKKENQEINEEKKNNYQESNKDNDKKDIPLELYFLLLEYKEKFLKEEEKFYSIKEYNDSVLSFWHYINKTNKKKERDILLKKYFPKFDKGSINLYSDAIQKLSVNLFKSNPLLSTENFSEIFFHYLSEFKHNYNDENKMNIIKQKIIKFLEKLRDFLEYVEIMQDKDYDSISRDIKLKNSRFIKEIGIRIKNELTKNKEKRNEKNIADIKNSTKMINETKNTLNALEENKNIFEDNKGFDPLFSNNFTFNTLKINKSTRNNYINNLKINNIKTALSSSLKKSRFFSPNKTGRMSSTTSTGFLLSDKKIYKLNHVENEKKNSAIIIDNDDALENQKSLDEVKVIDTPKYSKIKTNLKRSSRRYSSPFVDMQVKNNLINVLKKNNILKNDANNNEFDLSGSFENDKYKNRIYQSSSKLIKVKKQKNRVSLFSPINNKDSLQKSNYISKKSSISPREESKKIVSYFNIKNKNRNGNGLFNMKKSFNYDKFKDPLILLYDNIKKKQQIKKTDIERIKKYFKLKGKNFNLNFNSIDIIKKAKFITNQMDIERKTKRVFQPYLTYKQIQKLDDVTQINNKVHKLHIDYMNHIFDFKSKNSESIQAYL